MKQLGGVLLLSIGLVSGCATPVSDWTRASPTRVSPSANQANTASDDIDLDDVVEMVVLNETPNPVSVFVIWESGVRLRLGELGGHANRTFTTPLRDTGVWLQLDVLSGSRGLPRHSPSFVTVRAGDRIEWQIRRTYPSIDLFYRRLR